MAKLRMNALYDLDPLASGEARPNRIPHKVVRRYLDPLASGEARP